MQFHNHQYRPFHCQWKTGWILPARLQSKQLLYLSEKVCCQLLSKRMVFNRAQVATQLKELVQQQHRQLTQYRWGGQAVPHGHHPLPGPEGNHPTPGQSDEMSALRALIHSLRCLPHHCLTTSLLTLPLTSGHQQKSLRQSTVVHQAGAAVLPMFAL